MTPHEHRLRLPPPLERLRSGRWERVEEGGLLPGDTVRVGGDDRMTVALPPLDLQFRPHHDLEGK